MDLRLLGAMMAELMTDPHAASLPSLVPPPSPCWWLRLGPLVALTLLLGLAATAACGAVDDATLMRSTSVTVTISNLSQQFDGEPRAVTVTTSPSGITTLVTYNNSTTAPTATGSYTVVATVTQANYQGSATATLSIFAGSATTGATTAGTTASTTSSEATATSGTSSGSSGSSSSGLPCGLGSGTALVIGLALWGRRRS
jgi:hypothetical protein